MDEKQIQFLFDNYAKGKGFKDINEFRSLMGDEGSRKIFFDDSNKELGFKDYNDFEETIGVKKKAKFKQWCYTFGSWLIRYSKS
jgi:hypothetical protein